MNNVEIVCRNKKGNGIIMSVSKASSHNTKLKYDDSNTMYIDGKTILLCRWTQDTVCTRPGEVISVRKHSNKLYENTILS